MPDSPGGVRSRPVAPVALLVLAVVAGVAALQMRWETGGAIRDARASERRLGEDRLLAEDYRRLLPEALEISESVKDAHSIEFIESALDKNAVAAEGIDYRDPEGGNQQYDVVKIQIKFKSTGFRSLVSFLREVETGRLNLKLLEASVKREGDVDLWRGSLTYGALIPARSRS